MGIIELARDESRTAATGIGTAESGGLNDLLGYKVALPGQSALTDWTTAKIGVTTGTQRVRIDTIEHGSTTKLITAGTEHQIFHAVQRWRLHHVFPATYTSGGHTRLILLALHVYIMCMHSQLIDVVGLDVLFLLVILWTTGVHSSTHIVAIIIGTSSGHRIQVLI